MIANGVHHVSINVSDIETARDFYVDMLGLTEITRPELGFPGAWLQIGEQQLHLLQLPVPEHKGQHFALAVEDIDAAVATLRERGVEIHKLSEIAGVCRQAFLFDPSGNQVELNQQIEQSI